jgi:hypothetical protein
MTSGASAANSAAFYARRRHRLRRKSGFIATLYGSFFIYPVAIGGLAMAALLLPLTAAFCTPKTNRPIYVLLGLYVVTTIIVCALEFYAEPGALFQVRADSIGVLQPGARDDPENRLRLTTFQQVLGYCLRPRGQRP